MTTAPPLDQVQQRLAAFEEFMRWRELMLRRFADPAPESGHPDPTSGQATGRAPDPEPTERSSTDRDNMPAAARLSSEVAALRSAQKALLRHPLAVQAGYCALAAEGRRFAQTAEGKLWKQRIEGTTALEGVRTLFEALSLTMVDDDNDAILPSAFLELFVRSASSEQLEDIARELGLPFLHGEALIDGDTKVAERGDT